MTLKSHLPQNYYCRRKRFNFVFISVILLVGFCFYYRANFISWSFQGDYGYQYSYGSKMSSSHRLSKSSGIVAQNVIPFFDPQDDLPKEMEEPTENADGSLNIDSIYDHLIFPNISDPKQYSARTGLKESQLLEMEVLKPKVWSKENKMKVYVLLHSHNDAGWGRTFEEYFQEKTKHILDNLLHYLSINKELKFIWAEMSFFSLWWRELPSQKRLAVKNLIESKQLEFVNGGWVMPDEASVHYLSYFTQLIEGHQFLKEHFNVTPTNGWAIDPFGLSTSLNFLQTRAGMRNTAFMRVHYLLKHFLRERKATEFFWRQKWVPEGTGDIFSYLFPYGNYDKSFTCGSDTETCKSLFQKVLIPPENIAQRSLELLEGFRKKSQFFNTNNLLYPVGGDFYWSQTSDWTIDITNLKNVMEYVNSQDDLFTEMKFTTLDEYFTAVRNDIENGSFKPKTLIGDFFTYSDAHLDYWSGYFTSRIFHKATERQLMTSLRTAQLLFTFMSAEISKYWGNLNFKFIGDLLKMIIQARRDLSIFQHHDGITGTSRDYVVLDYSNRMHKAIINCQEVSMTSLFVLSNLKKFKARSLSLDHITTDNQFYVPTMYKERNNMRQIWQPRIFKIYPKDPSNDSSNAQNVNIVTVFNSEETSRATLITVGITDPNVKVVTMNDEQVQSEVFPIFLDSYRRTGALDALHFELHFLAELAPFEIKHYKILPEPKTSQNKVTIETFNVKNTVLKKVLKPFKSFVLLKNKGNDTTSFDNIELQNQHFFIKFSSKGTAERVVLKNGGKQSLFEVTFKYYYSGLKSGLYSFFPEGVARNIRAELNPTIITVKGDLKSYVEVWFPNVKHRLTLYHYKGLDSSAIEIQNTVDIRREKNYELLMHFETNITSKDKFYTDSNAFQMMERKRRDNLPIQGNYYPVAATVFIEDASLRMTLLAAQPSGGSSLKSGELEIMQDRINYHDDDHGIGQGGTDNLRTITKYKILFEDILEKVEKPQTPSLSLMAHRQLHNLLHPPQVYGNVSAPNLNESPDLENYRFFSLNYSIPCDILLVTSHILPEFKDSGKLDDTSIFVHIGNKIGVLFHRVGFDKRFEWIESLKDICSTEVSHLGHLNFTELFSHLFESTVKETTLSFNQVIQVFQDSSVQVLKPMQVYGYTVSFQNFIGDFFQNPIKLDLIS